MAPAPSKPIVYQGPAARQAFSLTESVMYYIAKNPSSPEVYCKLRQTCKWFYERLPLIVGTQLNGNKICIEDHRVCSEKHFYCNKGKEIDLQKNKQKLWIKHGVSIRPNDDASQLLSILNENLYNKGVAAIKIWSQQTIDLQDLMGIAASSRVLFLNVPIIDEVGKPAKLEKILEGLMCIEFIKVHCKNGILHKKTMKQLLKLQNFEKLERIYLEDITFSVDLDELWKFILKHRKAKQAYIFQEVAIEGPDYVERLHKLVDDIIADIELCCFICFEDQDMPKAHVMYARI